MSFLRIKRSSLIWIVVLGMVGCAKAPQPISSASDTVQSAAKPIAQSTLDELNAIAPSETEADIWARLQQPDTHYYVLMRHAIAPGTGDPANFQIDDCSTQRNLSDEGRAQAERTGNAFKEKNVSVQQVLSSEWCRCLETAELLDLGTVERFPALNSFFRNRDREPEQTAQLQDFMVTNRDDRGVTVMVTHFVNIGAIAGSSVSSGEMVVMQINDQNQPEIVERIGEF